MMEYETILYEEKEGIATVTLNRPSKLNAFDDQMIAETIEAIKAAGRDPAVRCLVITGSGRGFSSGQDLTAFGVRDDSFSIGDHLRHGYNRLVKEMVTLEKPIIGAINGVAAGAGCGVALAADIRIAAHTASFMLAFSKVGLIPDSGLTWLLPRLIGYTRAYEMAVTAEKVMADQALEWGMVNDVVPADQLLETAQAWAQKLAQGPTRAFGLTKRAMNRSLTLTLEEALAYEARVQEIAGRTSDNKEGVQAFLEKRPAVFQGK